MSDGKIGVDDFMVEHGVGAVREVIEAARPLDPDAQTDTGNARRFARQAQGILLYVPHWGTWLAYDGRRWARDAEGAARELAIEVARDMLLEAHGEPDDAKRKAIVAHAFRSQSRQKIDAMLSLAPDAAPELKIAPESLDHDPWLLNVANGTIDLRTGELRPHDARDLITQLVPVEYRASAKSTLWEKTLREILPDRETRECLQRTLGYCLTGSVREEKIFFLQGVGRNGKGTIVETVLAALSAYAGTAPEGLLLARKYDTHPTELADLYGKRLVIANETEQGRKWNGARVKMLTGGDRVKARRMHEDFWEFQPTHKIVVLSNSRPRADADDQALWRRMTLVPFEQEFRDPDDPDPARQKLPKKDTQLKAKLLGELPAVLAWLVQGCLAWQRIGIGEPTKVRAATDDYRDEQREMDPLTRFLENYEIGNKRLLSEVTAAFNRFAPDHSRSARELGAALRSRGYTVEAGAKNKTCVSAPAARSRPAARASPTPRGSAAARIACRGVATARPTAATLLPAGDGRLAHTRSTRVDSST